MTSLFDTHCHLDFTPFSGEVPSELAKAADVGVRRFLVPATGVNNWHKVMQLGQQHAEICYALGFHPYFLSAQQESDFTQLSSLLDSQPERCVALGECGLDMVHGGDLEKQERFFTRQLDMAKQYHLPVVLHCVKTQPQLIKHLKAAKLPCAGVIHGFSGSYEQAMEWIRLGFYLGIGGTITYARANKTRNAVAKVPAEYLVLETDAPDMPFYGHQGEVNHPLYLPLALQVLAELRFESQEELARQIWLNSHRLFALDVV